MRRIFIIPQHFFGLFIFLLFLNGCEKQQGDIYLRIYNNIDIAQDIVVKDQLGEVPVDGEYHKVQRFSETSYLLPDVINDSITSSNLPTPSWSRILRYDVVLEAAFGDFEILEEDTYYTLTLNYRRIITGPDEYFFGLNVYYMDYRYYDDSQLEQSDAP